MQNDFTLDIERLKRRGYCEAVFCKGKNIEQLIEIFRTFIKNNQNIIATKASCEQYEILKKEFSELQYNKEAKVITYIQNEIKKIGEIAIVTAGTGDIPIAQEVAITAEFYGSNVKKYYDLGIAGIHRLLSKIEDIKKANIIVAIAGMEGALPAIIAGLVDVPVIALPTSIGYGASFSGISALLTMLNSCAEGVSVVNIDNGYGAGYSANQINRLIELGKNNK